MTENRENHQHSCWTRTSKTAGNVDLRASARASLAPGEWSRQRKWKWHENRRESALLVKRRRARGRVFPAVKYESVENVTFGDYVGHWRTWGCQHAATKLNVPGRLRHSSVWQKSTISEKGWVFFSMFVSLFVCWHYLERCVTAGNSETEIPEDDLVHFPDACPWHLHRSSQSKRFAAPCEDLFSFYFLLFLD